jgi:hypothetical protein
MLIFYYSLVSRGQYDLLEVIMVRMDIFCKSFYPPED